MIFLLKLDKSMDSELNNQKNDLNEFRAYQARWIVPISRPPIENGIIVVEGEKIIYVDFAENIKGDLTTPPIDLGDVVVFPGFVNVHTHLEHNVFAERPSDFFSYQAALRAYNTDVSEDEKVEITKNNIKECCRFGTIALADFSFEGASSYPLLESYLFARVFHEITGFRGFDAPFILKKHHDKIKNFPTDKKVTRHLTPSSVWSLSPQLFREISVNERHIAIHLNMIEEEKEFILNGCGALKQYLLALEDYDYSWEVPGISPIKYFFNNHFYARHNILIHMVHVDESDIETIKESPSKVNICVCPRSDEALMLGNAPVNMFQKKGLNICMGTESKAIVPDLDIRSEMAKCVDLYGVSPEAALKFATLNGAYAVGFHREVGSLEPGKTAKCLVLKCGNSRLMDPYAAILESTEGIEWLM